MSGRIENNNIIKRNINNNLKELPEFVTQWYINLVASGKEVTSCNDYIHKIRNYLFSINSNLKEISLNDITMKSVESYYISIQTKIDKNGNEIQTSDSYKQGIWCALNSFLGFMYNRKFIPENFMSSISKPKNRDLQRINEKRILLTKDDFNLILKSVENGVGSNKAKAHQKKIKDRDMLIMLLFMQTGMRKTALSEINIEDIDINKKEILVIDKGNKRHVYYLTDNIIKYLKLWLNQRDKILDGIVSDALFISDHKKRLSNNAIYNLVEKYCEDALGERISPHKIRSGFCSILYNETNDAEFVRRAVGHSNISTTQRYIVTNNKEHEKAANIINDFLTL